MDTRTVEDIDRDLANYSVRRRDTLDRLICSMHMLNAIDHRVDQLLAQRSATTAGAR